MVGKHTSRIPMQLKLLKKYIHLSQTHFFDIHTYYCIRNTMIYLEERYIMMRYHIEMMEILANSISCYK